MFRPSVAPLLVALLACPAAAGLQLVETKKGKLYEAHEVLVVGDKLRMTLALKGAGQSATVSIPVDSVLPEIVYYAWASQIAESDVDGHLRLGAWCRERGLFRQAWREYIAAAESSEKVNKQLPELEQAMGEEAATWYFLKAEKSLRDGDVHAARVLAERVMADYPDSKEIPRTKGLLMLIREREQFLSAQKLEEKKAQRTKTQRRYVERQLKEIDSAKLMLRNTRMQYVVEARRRLYHASYRLRRSLHRLNDMVPLIEADDLRNSVQAVAKDTEQNMVASFTRLADLRYLSGDVAGALDAAHEVLWVDPDNKAMTDMRKRVLDSGTYRGYRFRYGYYDRFILRRCGYLPPFACPYPSRIGFGIYTSSPYRCRPVRVRYGSRSFVRYVR